VDPADRAQLDIDQQELARNRRFDATTAPYHPPQGTLGDCDICGRWSGRLIGAACAPCRDKYKLP